MNHKTTSRDASRRAQRFSLLSHDVPSLALPQVAATGVGANAPVDTKAIEAKVQDALRESLSSDIQARVAALVEERLASILHAQDGAEAIAVPLATQPVSAAPAILETTEVPAFVAERSDVTPMAERRETAAMPASTTGVRVVARNPVSGAAAVDSSASLARRAPAKSGQPELSPRCLPHTGQHYQGATQEDVVSAWQAMRDRYRLTPENKVLPRRSFIDWLKNQRSVCPDSIHWYGDFVVVRSCPVRAPENHASVGAEGWWMLFDPNGDGFLRTTLFHDAYDAPDSRFAGVVPRVIRPAWISEERRVAAAARAGKLDARPFSADSAEDLTAADFTRGFAE